MSDPVILPPTVQIHAVNVSEDPSALDVAQYYELLLSDFTIPATSAEGILQVANSDYYATNSYVYIQDAGFFLVTGKPNNVTVTVRNENTKGNTAALTIIPAGNFLMHAVPPEKRLWMQGFTTWDPASVADGDIVTTDVTVTGAVLGDYVIVSMDVDLKGCILTGSVTADDTVSVVLANNGATNPTDVDEGTLRALVIPQ